MRVQRTLQPVAFFEGKSAQIRLMAFDRPEPTFVAEHDRDGLLLDHRLGKLGFRAFRRLGKTGASAADLCLLSELVLDRFDLVADPLPLLVVRAEHRLQLFAFLGQAIVLALDFHLFQLPQ